MKQLIIKSITAMLCVLLSITSSASDFQVGGISYTTRAISELEVVSASYRGIIYIPSEVQYYGRTYRVIGIDENAFSNCSSLTSVSIPSSVTSIGSSAFKNCSSLSSISIPSSVTRIDDSVFSGCSSLSSVSIPSSVTSIGNYAFSGCSTLSSVNIPSSVTSIGYSAFSGCSSLSSINIPSSVTSIGSNVFSGCTGVLTVNCNIPSVSNVSKSAFNGAKFSKIIIGNNVASIGDYAFSDCTFLSSVSIPSSVTSIGSSAFSGCSSLSSINIPSSVTSIGSNVFSGCTGALTVNCNIPSVSNVSKSAFNGAKFSKIIIGNNVTSIGNYAFSGCSSLSSVNIPSSMTSIGDYAFSGCSSLSSVIIPSSMTSISSHVFSDCSSLTSVSIPSSVTSIGDYAFSGCSSLSSVNIPSSVTNIGFDAFRNCSSLSSVIIPSSVTSISSSVFSDCSSLTSVSIPSSVTNIGFDAFRNCSSLSSVNIPSSVTIIGSDAFLNCSSLSSVNIPSSVTRIGSSAFSGCSSLSDVNVSVVDITLNSILYDYLPSTSKWHYYIDSKLVTVLNIPSSVTKIGDYAFYNANDIVQVNIPSSVTSIGTSAFGRCKGELTVNCNIPSVSSSYKSAFYGAKFSRVMIGDQVTSIGDYAFSQSNIKTLTIGSGVTYIGCSVSPIKTIWLTNTPPTGYKNVAGKINYVSNNNFSFSNMYIYPLLSSAFEVDGVKYAIVSASERTCDAIDCAYDSSTESINIGQTVNYKNVELKVRNVNPYTCAENNGTKSVMLSNAGFVGANAFVDCVGLTKAEMTNAGNIGSYAFLDCTGLTKAKIKNCGAVEASAFSGCKSLNDVTLGDQVSSLGEKAFQNCESIEKIIIPNSVEKIGNYCFSGCKKISELAIPQSVTTIGDYAFQGCSSLSDFTISNRTTSLTLGSNGSNPLFYNCPLNSIYIGGQIIYKTSSSYGYSPFYRNTSLRSVVITDMEKEIYDNEFYGCTALKSVKIGDGVTKIGNWAFSGCSSLESFSFGSKLENIGKEAFSDCTAMTKVVTKASVPPTCGSQALEDINKWECTLYVPERSIATYQNADQWKDFFFVNSNSGMVDDSGDKSKRFDIVDGTACTIEQPFKTECATYTRTFNNTNWQALYVPFSMSYNDWKDNFDVARINAFYEYDTDNDGLIDKQILEVLPVTAGIGDLKPNTPYLIKAKTTGEKTIVLQNATIYMTEEESFECSTMETKYSFTGTYSKKTGMKTAGYYFMSSGSLKTASSDAVSLGAFRWYMKPESKGGMLISPNAQIKIRVIGEDNEEDASGILGQEANVPVRIFTLDGRQLNATTTDDLKPGIYIVNGKKQYIK